LSKYQLDWKMKIFFWVARRGLAMSGSNLRQVQAGSNSGLLDLFFPHYPVAKIEDRSIPGRQGTIPVRIYRPAGSAGRPVVVFFHGGGWVLGGLKGHNAICRRVAAENEVVVVAVDYRLAPEHKFPAAVEDAYDATCWAASHAAEFGAAPEKTIVMGDSAGGNLSAVVSILARDAATPRIAGQVLIYPAVDLVGRYPSQERYSDNPVLSGPSMAFFKDAYFRFPADASDPRVSPMRVEDLSRLPPALVLTAEYDPLCDEGQAYAERLRSAGNEASVACFPGMPHGFLSFGRLASQADAAFGLIQEAVARFAK
jgi:acetyl esterase